MDTVNSHYPNSTGSSSVENMESPVSALSPLRDDENFNINDSSFFDNTMGKNLIILNHYNMDI